MQNTTRTYDTTRIALSSSREFLKNFPDRERSLIVIVYLRAPGWTGAIESKAQASALIDRLKAGRVR